MIGSSIPENTVNFIRETLANTNGEVKETVLIIDMINDFLHEKGVLYSNRHEALIPEMKNFIELFRKGLKKT